jgi:hypothetical protein
MRQDPAPPAGALEAFVVDETAYPLEDWLQAFREVEIEIELLLLGMDFEDDREYRHCLRPSSCRKSGRSVSLSADRVPGITIPTDDSIDR